MKKDQECYIKTILNMELSDIIFKQHIHSYMPLNIIIFIIQILILIISIVVSMFKISIVTLPLAFTNILLCVIVLCNNYIHLKTWNKSKDKLNRIKELLYILDIENENEQYSLLIDYLKEKNIKISK